MKPHIIVLGNEKGGTGKSTVAMHLTVHLLNEGFKVGTIDVDARQGTFTQYFEHRKKASDDIKLPEHVAILSNNDNNREKARSYDTESLSNTLERLADRDFIVIDTPGNDTYLSQMAHSYADTLITPMNDSFVDLDVLVRILDEDMKALRPSIYAEMVWNQRKERAKRGEKPIDWIVIRNRLTTLYTKNKRDISVVLEALAKRVGFRLGTGFCERVIFKELFLSGLTLLDLDKSGVQLNISHVAARQELRELINFMKLPNLQ
ncbi:MAG: division plane positioning ATPase MipZ [Holosporaceae bacterium]|nr:division plane positioning ATPase MipZ [Holosporaceae bacterium]